MESHGAYPTEASRTAEHNPKMVRKGVSCVVSAFTSSPWFGGARFRKADLSPFSILLFFLRGDADLFRRSLMGDDPLTR